MSYVVLTRFAYLQDGNRIYEAGEEYPRPGLVVTEKRVAELAGSDNLAGKPLIKAVGQPNNADGAEPKEIPAQSAEAPKKARRGRQKG